MSRVEDLLKQDRNTLIGYFPAGYPTIDESVQACLEMVNGGVEILELGVPYSDPIMDGPVIQKATEIARANGFRLRDTFEVVKRLRESTDVPILVMTYWNPVIRIGLREFAEQLKQSGADGLITPDLIPDEAKDWISISDELDLDRVFLIAPSSSDERIKHNAEASRGFVYTVSTMGITGERGNLDALARNTVERLRAVSDRPTAVGVGISTGDQVKEVNSYADGAIVGTAFIRAYAENGLAGLIEKTKDLANGLELQRD
ncbi:MAG: tryptophan synthase subunit alpha [Microbacteriaceae bacterium]|nr:tryptophan synthase subunit alpha [Microbacteriaceae bacterium]